MDEEILSFIDFFESYSSEFLVLTALIAGGVWLSFRCWSWGDATECYCTIHLFFTAVVCAFFDLTSGAANAITDHGPRKLHAIGSALHCVAIPIHMIIPNSEYTARVDFFMFYLLFVGEFLELLAMVMSISDDKIQWVTCVVVLSVGGFTVLTYLCHQTCSNPAIALKGLVAGFQIMYIIIVTIAATSNWRRLLWILPEVPFETLSLLARNTGTRDAAETSSEERTCDA